MSEWAWIKIDPAKTYSPWKKTLKEIAVRRLYRTLINDAARYADPAGRNLLLKTDLWVECLGLDELEALEKDYEIYGIDLSRGVCAHAKPIMSRRNVACASIGKLPFRSETFSVLVDISTIDHVRYDEGMTVVSEYARVLKPNGIILMCIDSKLSLPWEAYRKILLKYDAYSWLWKYVREITLANGLEIVKAFFANTFLDSFSGLVMELAESRWNRLFSILAQYYVIIAKKPNPIR